MRKIQILWLALAILASIVCSGFVVTDAFLYDITDDTFYLYRGLLSMVIAIVNIYNSIRIITNNDEDELYEVES